MILNPLDVAFRAEWNQLLATLMADLGDLDLAEEVAQEAFAVAAERWHKDGVPSKPGAWLLTTARRKAIDKLRRVKSFDDRIPLLAQLAEAKSDAELTDHHEVKVDEQFAMILGCCHPGLSPEAQVALTLRYVAGLKTVQIAKAFLVPEATMAKRLVRAKAKIKAAGIPFAVPEPDRIGERLEAVCGVIYAIFTEGHTSSSGVTLMRGNLCDEALWLAENLAAITPDDSEVRALAALCLLTDARRQARADENGLPVLLADQNRSLWSSAKISRGLGHLLASQLTSKGGGYQHRAALAAVHALAPSYDQTDWTAIIGIYDAIANASGNSAASSDAAIVGLNRAAAVLERDGAEVGLAAIEAANVNGNLDHYHYYHSGRGEALARLGRSGEARSALARALDLCDNAAEAEWLERRRAAIGAK